MKTIVRIYLIFFSVLPLLSYSQVRTKNNRYIEFTGGIRDLNLDYKSNFGASISFVSASRIKAYKRFNFGYDTYYFNINQLGKKVPVERIFASYTVEPVVLKGKKQKSYIGVELGGGVGYESINKGANTIDNFTITNGTSQVVGLLFGGINAEKYIGKGFAIGLKETLAFSPLSNVQKLTFQSSISFKFKLANKL